MSDQAPKGDEFIPNPKPSRAIRRLRDKVGNRTEQLQENARWIADLSKRTPPQSREDADRGTDEVAGGS